MYLGHHLQCRFDVDAAPMSMAPISVPLSSRVFPAYEIYRDSDLQYIPLKIKTVKEAIGV